MSEENKAPACKPCEDCRKKELTNKEQEQAAGGAVVPFAGLWNCPKCGAFNTKYAKRCDRCGMPVSQTTKAP